MDANEIRFTVGYPPHLLGPRSVRSLFGHRLVALIPVVVAAVIHFRLAALITLVTALVTALCAEALMQWALKRPLTLTDGSAAFSAIILACLLPATTPWWVVTVGAAAAMVLGKHLFGGLGNHPFMDALVGWIFVQISWPDRIAEWVESAYGWIANPPLLVLQVDGLDAFVEHDFHLTDLLLGIQAGGLGTGCGLAILIGGIYLLIVRAIDWRIPAGFLISLGAVTTLLWWLSPATSVNPLVHFLAGSALLGALFIATDPVTSPTLGWPKFLFGVLCGLLVMAIRLWGTHVDGVTFAIFLANAATPLLNKWPHRPFGRRGRS